MSCPCPDTVLNLGSNQRKWKWSRNARYEGHRSPHPMYSRPAPTVCDEVNRSGLHMSSLPLVSQTVKLPIKQHDTHNHEELCHMVQRSNRHMVSIEWRWSYDGKFILDTDISDTHVGAELMLIQDEEEKIISYNSIALSEKERRYCMTDVLAIVGFIGKYRCYLLRRPLFEFNLVAEVKWATRAAIQSDQAAVPVHVEDAGIGLGLTSQWCFIS